MDLYTTMWFVSAAVTILVGFLSILFIIKQWQRGEDRSRRTPRSTTTGPCNILPAKGGKIGLAIVIANEYEDLPEDHGRLVGTAKDKERWEKLLEDLQFDVRTSGTKGLNASRDEMLDLIGLPARIHVKNKDVPTCRYVVFVFSGHGYKDGIVSEDLENLDLQPEVIPLLFCERLYHFNKLIFIDACRSVNDGPGQKALEISKDMLTKGSSEDGSTPSVIGVGALTAYATLDRLATSDSNEGSDFSKFVTEGLREDVTVTVAMDRAIENVIDKSSQYYTRPMYINQLPGEVNLYSDAMKMKTACGPESSSNLDLVCNPDGNLDANMNNTLDDILDSEQSSIQDSIPDPEPSSEPESVENTSLVSPNPRPQPNTSINHHTSTDPGPDTSPTTGTSTTADHSTGTSTTADRTSLIVQSAPVTGEVSSQIPEVADPVNVVTDPVLDSKPEVVRVLELVGSKMSEDWEKFAVYLGFTITKLPTIREDFYGCGRSFMALVGLWLEEDYGTGDLPRTWRSVLQAVRDCGHTGLADDVTASLSKVTGEVSSQIPEVADPVNVVTDPVLDSKPEVVRVLELVGSKMSKDWEKFAVYLGFKITKLPTIREDFYGCGRSFMALVGLWLEEDYGTGDLPRTWRSVLQAVRDCGHTGLADDVTASLSKVTGEVSSQIPEVADPVNVVTAPQHQSGMDTVIDSHEDLLKYQDDMIAHLALLGTVLGISQRADAIIQEERNLDNRFTSIVKYWLEKNPGATWKLFCDKLKAHDSFNCLRYKIENDHN